MQEELNFSTSLGDVVDLTEDVACVVTRSGVKSGLVNVFAPHATGVLFLGESEQGINRDYVRLMKELAGEGKGWMHDRIDSNAHAHLRSALFGASVTVPVVDGKMAVGVWQRILFVENDRNRSRRVIVTVCNC